MWTRSDSSREKSTPSALAAWFVRHGTRHHLKQDVAHSVRDGRLLYLAQGILQIDFAPCDGGSPQKSAALLFEREVLDLGAFKFVPRGSFRAIGPHAEFFIAGSRQVMENPPPLEVLEALGAFTGRLARQSIANTTLDIEERLCTLLVALGVRIGTRENDCVEFDFLMSRDAMAALLGVRSESLSRAISQARESGLIKLDGRSHVTVPDWMALCAKSRLSDFVIAANGP